MLKEMTLGQYYPVDSFLHRLDPRTKLAGTMLYIISLFIADSFLCYALTLAFLLFCIRVSRVPFGYILKGLKPIFFLMAISVIFNLFLTSSGEVLWQWKFLRITEGGFRQALFMAMRLGFLVMGSSLMTYTTTPTALTDGMERGLRFLRVFRVPVHEIAMMMSIALRFIPILAEEADKIQKAQMARGANFEEGGVIARAKAMIPLLVPLFISAFRRATDLAMAMEARCYHGGEGRTKMFPLRYHRADWIAYTTVFLYLILLFVLRTVF